jgi:hypothetical protein
LLKQPNELRRCGNGSVVPMLFGRANFFVLANQRFGIPERSLFSDWQRIGLLSSAA